MARNTQKKASILGIKRKTRPTIKVDWKLVDKLLLEGCEGTEVAARLGMHPETLYDKIVTEKRVGFTEYKTKMRESGNTLLRSKQFNLAMKEDRAMLIWLGKNRLKQSDNPQAFEEFSGEIKEYINALKEKCKTELDSSMSTDDANPDKG